MSFQTGLSGLNAASRNLDVIGNNIANANTVGMKSSRVEFSDMVASSLGAGGAPVRGVAIGAEGMAFGGGCRQGTGQCGAGHRVGWCGEDCLPADAARRRHDHAK